MKLEARGSVSASASGRVTGATVAGYVLAKEVFSLKYTPDPWVWVIGIVGGAVLVGTAGVLAARSVVTQPPMATLRQGNG